MNKKEILYELFENGNVIHTEDSINPIKIGAFWRMFENAVSDGRDVLIKKTTIEYYKHESSEMV